MATTSFTNSITLTDAAWFNDADKAAYAYLTGVSGTNTITATGSAALSAYAAGVAVRFIPANTNTGATTINITQSGASALGARNVFYNGAACVGGELVAGRPYLLIDDGTRFHIVNGGTDPQGTTASTFTWNGGGGSTGSLTMSWKKSGSFVTLMIPTASATTGTGSTTLTSNTALPTYLRPSANTQSAAITNMKNNATALNSAGIATVTTGGIVNILRDNVGTAFTDAAAAGTTSDTTITYYVG